MTSDIAQVCDFLEHVSRTGPIAPEYDGLRIFQHPSRALNEFIGMGVNVTPVTIDLWPALTCNARCPLCPYRLSGARDSVDQSGDLDVLGLELAGMILSGAVASGVESIIFTGGGDPLLNPDLFSIVRYTKALGLQWGMFTNGILLTSSVATTLLSIRPAFLRVSLDAGSPETHARIYGVREDVYDSVIKNIVNAAKAAKLLGSRAFGLSFTLATATPDAELRRIKQIIEHIAAESEGGLGIVAFRPRVIHYREGTPLCPQPDAGRFVELADRIEREIIKQVKCDNPCEKIAFDIKKGLFVLADRTSLPRNCLSGGWITTVTQEGVAYATAELAGVVQTGQSFGTISQDHDFKTAWNGALRRKLYNEMVTGEIKVPVVHRTSPIDEMLRSVDQILGGPIDRATVEVLLQSVATREWYRSKRSEFV